MPNRSIDTRMKRSVKLFRGLTCALALFLTLNNAAYGFTGDVHIIRDERLSPSTTWHEFETMGKRGLHLVRVRWDDPLTEIRAAGPNRLSDSVTTVTGYASGIDQPGNSVVATVNGDFFFTSSDLYGLPTGLFVRDGELITFRQGQPAFTILSDGRPWIGIPQAELTVVVLDRNGQETARRAVTAINKPRNVNDLVLYTERFGPSTKTNPWGTEVLLTGVSDPLTTDTIIEGQARLIEGQGHGDMLIHPQTLVLSGHGEASDFLSQAIESGSRVQIVVKFSSPWDEAVMAVGGLPLLVENGRRAPLVLTDPLVSRPAPRTIVAQKGDELWFLTFAGRGTNGMEGWSLPLVSDWLIQQGVETAINLDGGGSSTLAVRLPGQWPVSVVNTLSDGSARRVANSVQIVSTAPLGKAQKLQIATEHSFVLPGGITSLRAFGIDEYFNPIDMAGVQWHIDDRLSLTNGGQFIEVDRDAEPGSYDLRAAVDGLQTQATIVVPEAEEIARVELNTPPNNVLELGSVWTPSVQLFHDNGQTIAFSSDSLTWRIDGDSLRLDADGKLHAESVGTATLKVEYRDHELGKWEIAVLEDPSQPGQTPAPAEPIFRDLQGSWAHDAVARLVQKGAISGYPDGTFRPDRLVTRAEFIKMLVEALSSAFPHDPNDGSAIEFTDRDVWPDWARTAIERAAANQVVQGMPDGGFQPNRNLSRQETVTIIIRSLDSSEKVAIEPVLPLPFTDADQVGDWAVPYAALAAGAQLLQGYDDGTFRPLRTVTRAEAAMLIDRLLNRLESPAS